VQSNAYLRSIGKSRLGRTPKAVRLADSQEGYDHIGLPTADPFEPYGKKVKKLYDTVQPPLSNAFNTTVDITQKASDGIKDGVKTLSDGLDYLSWFLPSSEDLPESVVTDNNVTQERVTLLPSGNRTKTINMFTAMQDNPNMVIGSLQSTETLNWFDEQAVKAMKAALLTSALAPSMAGGLPGYGSITDPFFEDFEGIVAGEYSADREKIPWQKNSTYQEIAILIDKALSGKTIRSNSEKPIIGMFSQNTPTFLWPWTTENGERYTAVDFAEMPFFETGIGDKIKEPFEIVMGRQYNKVGDLPAYGAWGDIALGLPVIILLVAGATVGLPAMGKLGRDGAKLTKQAVSIPFAIAGAARDKALDVAAKLDNKIKDLRYPRMKYTKGKYVPADVEAEIPVAHKIKMYFQRNKQAALLGTVGFAGLVGVSYLVNKKFGVAQNISTYISDQKRELATSTYVNPRVPTK